MLIYIQTMYTSFQKDCEERAHFVQKSGRRRRRNLILTQLSKHSPATSHPVSPIAHPGPFYREITLTLVIRWSAPVFSSLRKIMSGFLTRTSSFLKRGLFRLIFPSGTPLPRKENSWTFGMCCLRTSGGRNFLRDRLFNPVFPGPQLSQDITSSIMSIK